jgi:membrane associated rhomboid family serine protease
MGLADRHYMRDSYHASNVTIKLIVVLIVAFVIESLLLFYGRWDVINHLGLTVAGIKAGKIWQLFTFQFLHSTPWPWHVLFNCLGLYFFGRPVEQLLGPKKFLLVYLLAGIIGGLLQAIITLLLPNHLDIPVVGASAGICGVIAIFCSLNPMQEMTAWVYFFPVTIRAKYFLMFLGGLSLFGTLVPFDNVAHAAHLGGIFLGLAYVRWSTAWEGLFNWKFFKSGQRKKKSGNTKSKSPAWLATKSDATDLPSEEFISREVDPILDKISQQGIQSLTDRERKILEAARSKMAKR